MRTVVVIATMIVIMAFSTLVMPMNKVANAEDQTQPDLSYFPDVDFITFPHDKIIIENNFDFEEPDSVSGVVSGIGTINDPYIIEGWEIDQRSQDGSCIYIADTDAYVTIRNCYLHDAEEMAMDILPYPDDWVCGVSIYNAENIKIENCVMDDFGYMTQGSGVRADMDSSDIYIGNCSISDCSDGAWWLSGMFGNTHIYNCTVIDCDGNNDFSVFTGSTGYSVKNCSITGQSGHAIAILGFASFIIENNTCWQNYPYWALYMSGVEYSKVCFNNFYNNGRGIMFAYTNNNSVFNNTFRQNDYGIWIFNSEQDHVFWNRFIDNTDQYYFYQDNSNPYWWNLTYYDGGGNYWSDYAGTDIYSGENQDETGRDYIGDQPYEIGIITDYYPLINASGWVNLTIPKVANFTVGQEYLQFEFYEYMNTTTNGTILTNATIEDAIWVSTKILRLNITPPTQNETYYINITGIDSKDGTPMEDFNEIFSAIPNTTQPVEPDPEPEEPEAEQTTGSIIATVLISLIPVFIIVVVMKIFIDEVSTSLELDTKIKK